MKTMNEVLIILANNHLWDKVESVLHEINSYVGYQASLNSFVQTDVGKVYKSMISFGYEVDIESAIGAEMSDYSRYFQLPPRDTFLAIVKAFEAIEDEIIKLWGILGGNVVDKLHGWMYEWIETVAYAYDSEKWAMYQELYESLDVSFTHILTGQALEDIEAFLRAEVQGAD